MDIPKASFLGIPLELRKEIYALCFNKWVPHDPRYRRAIASACRQTRSEAFPMLLGECRSFTLEQFVAWTGKGNPSLLQHVTDVFLLHCTISALRPVSEYIAIQETDLLIMRRIFSSIPNLQQARFILYPPYNDPIRKQTDFHETFLEVCSTCCPGFADLDVISDLVHISSLQSFQNLQSLEWSGLSLSTPQETLVVLSLLPYLHKMKITRWPEYYDKEKFSVPSEDLHRYVSFTPFVLERLRPLKQFQIRHMSTTMLSDFLTVEMLKALAPHSERLTRLELCSDHMVEDAVLDEVLSLMSTLNLEALHVQFDVPLRYKAMKLADFIAPSIKRCYISMRILDGKDEIWLKHNVG